MLGQVRHPMNGLFSQSQNEFQNGPSNATAALLAAQAGAQFNENAYINAMFEQQCCGNLSSATSHPSLQQEIAANNSSNCGSKSPQHRSMLSLNSNSNIYKKPTITRPQIPAWLQNQVPSRPTNSKLLKPKLLGSRTSAQTEAFSDVLGDMRFEIERLKQQLEVKAGVVDAVQKLLTGAQSTPNLWENNRHTAHGSLNDLLQDTDSSMNDEKSTRYKKENAINNLKYKTSVCRHFEKKGSCPLGDDCQFAHGPKELREIYNHPLYKTRICRLHVEKNACPYGDRCYYYHTEEERQAAIMARELEAARNRPLGTSFAQQHLKSQPNLYTSNIQHSLNATTSSTASAMLHQSYNTSVRGRPAIPSGLRDGLTAFSSFDNECSPYNSVDKQRDSTTLEKIEESQNTNDAHDSSN